MNCDHFTTLTGMRCEPVPTRDGSAVIAVMTPFTFADGDGIEMFAEQVGGQFRLFDEGLTLLHLHSVGIRLGDRRRWQPLRKAVQPHGVTLTDDGVLEGWAPLAEPGVGFARFTSALLSLAAWEREHQGLPMHGDWLVEEAKLYLRAWKPAAELVEKPEPLRGLSGRRHGFDFSLDGEYVDAISANGNSTGAELRKLVDLKHNPEHRNLQVRVIVDDRRVPDAAAEEVSILGRFAKAWTMSGLMAAATRRGATAAMQ
jgi:hypothetical protein